MGSYMITGGCGFIGSHLADFLVAAGHSVRILDDLSTGRRDNPPAAAEVIIGDVTDAETVRAAMAGQDACFHLAAIASVPRSVADPIGTNRVNLAGTINVLDAAYALRPEQPAPVVYASSAAIYGAPDDPAALTEDACPRPMTPYAADKIGSEHHAQSAGVTRSVPSLGLRFFNVFGPRQDPSSPYSGVISIFIDRLMRGEPLTIFGDGQQTRDFIYVGDVVRGLVTALAHASPQAGAWNICTGIPTSVGDLATTLGALMDKPVTCDFQPARRGDIRTSVGNPGLAAAHGFTATTSLRDGLALTVPALVG